MRVTYSWVLIVLAALVVAAPGCRKRDVTVRPNEIPPTTTTTPTPPPPGSEPTPGDPPPPTSPNTPVPPPTPPGQPTSFGPSRLRVSRIAAGVPASGIPVRGGMVLAGSDDRLPSPGRASVRVIHGASDAPALDILVNDRPVMVGLTFGEATAGAHEIAAGTYRVAVVRAAGSRTTSLNSVPLTFRAGGVYTLVATGMAEDRTLDIRMYEE